MPYRPSVKSSIELKTTSVTGANFSSLLFASANNFFLERTRAYASFDEVRNDVGIPTDSNAYEALRLAFGAPNAATPMYLARREADLATYTPNPDAIGLVKVYTMTITTASNTDVVEYTSLVADDAESVCTGLKAIIDGGTAAVTATVVGTGSTAVLTVASSGLGTVVVTTLKNLSVTFTTSETAAELLEAILNEAGEDFYYVTTEDKTQEFILDMASEIEATGSGDFPKQYHVSISDANVLTPVVDPAVDTLGKLKELGYTRTSGRWHDEASSLFPEVFAPAYQGNFEPLQGRNWKFIIPAGIAAASDLTSGKRLTTSQQGYIADRDGSWYGAERGSTFNHGGRMASGNWIDNILLADRINDLIEVGWLNLLLNSPTGSIKMDEVGKSQVASVSDSVLTRAVNAGGLQGFIPTQVPTDVPFADQANRILENITFTGYLNANVNFISSNGVLTYQDETLA